MKFVKYIILISIMFSLSGCEFLDEIFKFNTKQKKQISKPFKVVFQKESDPKTILITSKCKYNKPLGYIYYESPEDVTKDDTKIFLSKSTKSLKPFWDIRYTNSVEKFIEDSNDTQDYADYALRSGLDARVGNKNVVIGSDMSQTDYAGSFVEAKCIDGILSAGTNINLKDAPEQYIDYAGPQSTFTYHISNLKNRKPWKSNKSGNLMLQAYFNTPIYSNYSTNKGGSINFGVILKNKKTNKYLNYIIGIYATGDAWMKELAGIQYDPTTNMIHVATVINDDSWWSTKSPKSDSITKIYSTFDTTSEDQGWNNFYRVNISYNNLKAVLNELKNNPPAEAEGEEFGVQPQDWEITSIFIQYEVEESGGKAILSGSFQEFEAYTSKLPL